MIEVTILKVQHVGEDEARKLLPYVQNCDVYSPENPYATERISASWEAGFEQASKLNRTQFSKVIQALLNSMRPDDFAYFVKQYDYLYRAKRPLWFLERCSPEERQKVQSVVDSAKNANAGALSALERGQLEDFMGNCSSFLRLEAESFSQRDMIMGRTIQTAEEQIRSRYAQLRDREPLRYVAAVGALHSPEKHTSIPVKVVDLWNPPKTVQYRFDLACQPSIDADVVKRDILAYGALHLSQKGFLSFTEPEIREMSIDVLLDVVQAHCRA